jgi:hypothetical protein
MRQAQAASNRRKSSMTRFNALARQIVLAVRRNAIPPHLKPIKISAKRK